MGEDVAVPDVAAGFVEGRLDPGHLTRIPVLRRQSRDHVLGRVLDITRPGIKVRPHHDVLQPEANAYFPVVLHHILFDHVRSKFPSVQDLEMHEMQVHRVGVPGGVVDLPDLCGIQRRVLRGG